MSTPDAPAGGGRTDLRRPSAYAALGALLLGAAAGLLLLPLQAVRALFSEAALGYTQDTSGPRRTSAAAGSAWEASTADPGLTLLLRLLVSLVACGLASAGLVSLLIHDAGRRRQLDVDIYHRLLQGLTVWGAANAGFVAINTTNFKFLPWALLIGLFGAVALAASAPLRALEKGSSPVRESAVLNWQLRGWRGALYGALGVFLFLEAPPILLLPKRTLEAVFGLSGGAVGRVLWQLVALSVHTIVPTAVLNLKPLAEQRALNSATAAYLNLAALVPGLVHLYVVARALLGGLTGPLAPAIAAAWTTTTLFSLVNLPARVRPGRY